MPITNLSSYLLTGCLNPLGISIAKQLLSKNSTKSINLIDNIKIANVEAPTSLLSSDKFSLYLGDVRNDFLVKRILAEKKIECIIFFIPFNFTDAVTGARQAIDGIIQLLDAARQCPTLKSLVVVSSDLVYGTRQGSQTMWSENDVLAPDTLIGAAEMGAEAMAHSYMMSYKLPIAIVRLASGVVCGKGIIVNAERLVGIKDFINLIYVDDAARGILHVSERAEKAEVWNIGGERDYSIDWVKNNITGKTDDNSSTLNLISTLNTDKIRATGWKDIEMHRCDLSESFENGDSAENNKVPEPKILVYGARGWIGQQLIDHLKDIVSVNIVEASKRPGFDTDEIVRDEIVSCAPSHVICTVGRTHGEGINSIAYLEGGPEKLKENMRDNLYAPWLLAALCEKLGIHCTYIGTGCIYKYDEEHQMSGKAYTEDEFANYYGTSYSAVKGFTDRLLRQFPDCLQCRIRLPVNYKDEDRNLVAKLIRFSALVDIPNSISVLPDILPIISDLVLKKKSGVWNLVNPSPISFAEIGSIYNNEIDGEKSFKILEATEELLNSRSNCTLSTDKLMRDYPHIPTIHDAIKLAIQHVTK